MLELNTPNGLSAMVPETAAEDPSPHFRMDQLDEIKAYYEANGYVVVEGVLDAAVCDEMRGLWEAEIKPSTSPIYRQTGSNLQVNDFNAQGWIMNPVLNPHSVDPREFPAFRRASREKVLNSGRCARVLSRLFGERPKIVQAMYFEGNSATWEHQDSYYLDSEHVGAMAGVWLALEDIQAEAGRFFVCPGSHLLDWPRQSRENNVADAHDVYIANVIEKYRASNSSVRAPALKKGDAIFWNAFTIHGSLGTQHEAHSRSSMTAHAIPASHKFLKLNHIVVDVPTEDLGNVLLYSAKDMAGFRHRAIKWVEWNFPGIFYKLKAMAVKRAVSGG